MLKSYEAIYDHGKIQWLAELPDVEQARIIVTILPETIPANEVTFKRRPPAKLKGSATVLGDIVTSPFSEEEWEAMFERTARQIEGVPEDFK